MVGPMIVNIHQHHTTVLHEPLLGRRFICGGDHLQLTKVPGVDPSAGGKFSNSPRKGGYYGVHISHLDIPKKGKPCFFPPGPWCRGWTRNMEFPNGVPLVSLGKARVTVDASTPPPPYRWCPEPGAWRCQVWSVPVFGDMETPENTMENRWKTCGKHTYLNS